MRICRMGVMTILAWGLVVPIAASSEPADRVTILFDAFGERSELKKDWGFSALIESGGKRVLFDAGNDSAAFEHNLKALGVSLKSLDGVVISHRHGDHTNGMHHLLKVNPGVAIYVPADEHFGGPTPDRFYKRGVEALPKRLRYFDGSPPNSVPHGTAWQNSNLIRVTESREILPGVRAIATVSRTTGTLEMPELSLSLKVKDGQILVVGCSHTGIEPILEAAGAAKVPVRLLIGGLHLVTAPEADIVRVARSLRDTWKVAEVAPGHCTGEPGFAALMEAFGDRFVYAGLGTRIPLP
ncbi:MBL fold metallo-hydrolase [Singulisphaera sp. PoT]|uniref:MBL fold metallo-hydrolase n=1 Tax=Singulisphaera sp. PoT TaxID=3411797 RepID=UPI003BF4EB37